LGHLRADSQGLEQARKVWLADGLSTRRSLAAAAIAAAAAAVASLAVATSIAVDAAATVPAIVAVATVATAGRSKPLPGSTSGGGALVARLPSRAVQGPAGRQLVPRPL